jgi:hypothetical protein
MTGEWEIPEKKEPPAELQFSNTFTEVEGGLTLQAQESVSCTNVGHDQNVIHVYPKFNCSIYKNATNDDICMSN